jgi:hypothetical protein
MNRGDIQRVVKAIRAAETLDEAMGIAIASLVKPTERRDVPLDEWHRRHLDEQARQWPA